MNQRPVGHAVDVHARASVDAAAAPLADDAPFHILIVGDFAGTDPGNARSPLSTRAPQQVDRDDLDDVMARMAPGIAIRPEGGAGTVRLVVRKLDDLHPDQVCEDVPHVRSLVELRRRLADPATFRRALNELESADDAGGAADPPPAPSGATPPMSGAGLLDAIVAESADVDVSPTLDNETDLNAFVRKIVRPHLVDSDPRQPEVLSRVDEAIATGLRSLLHDSAFQDLERVWRSTWFLVRRLETSPTLKVYVLDVSAAELVSDEGGQALKRVMVDERIGTPGATPWSLIVVDRTFGGADEDVELMRHLTATARAAGAPIVAAADPSLVMDGDWPAHLEPAAWTEGRRPSWTTLRQSPDASWLALTFPRFLLRMPYGAEDDPCDAVPFEEATEQGLSHGTFLWGNSAFVIAALVGAQYAATGRSPRLSANLQLDGLPLYVQRGSGKTAVQPCAEVLASERWAGVLLEHGVIPVMSVRDADAVRIARVQSAALPATALSGRWS